MTIAAWITSGMICLAALAAEEPGKQRAKPEPPVAPDEWTRAIEGKHGLWQLVKGEPKVVDGVITFPIGKSLLQSEHLQRNFTVSFEWKSDFDGPTRAALHFHSVGKGGELTGYSISLLRDDAGTLSGKATKKCPYLTYIEKWNSFELEVKGETARLKILGYDAWEINPFPMQGGILAISAEVPEGARFQIRNLSVVESGYRPLFNGRDLDGWTGGGGKAEDCWQVSEGLLQCTGGKGPWLKSNEEYGDFNLRLEYRLPPKGNSGVYVRVPADGNHHGKGAGVEIQVLDDAHKAYAQLQKYQYTGSVYAVAPATAHVARPAGEWNSLEINCKAQSYRVIHNGVTIVDVDEKSHPALKERRLKGFFGLQNHSSVVSFRNIRLGPAE